MGVLNALTQCNEEKPLVEKSSQWGLYFPIVKSVFLHVRVQRLLQKHAE